jgi:hypothetical protein
MFSMKTHEVILKTIQLMSRLPYCISEHERRGSAERQVQLNSEGLQHRGADSVPKMRNVSGKPRKTNAARFRAITILSPRIYSAIANGCGRPFS